MVCVGEIAVLCCWTWFWSPCIRPSEQSLHMLKLQTHTLFIGHTIAPWKNALVAYKLCSEDLVSAAGKISPQHPHVHNKLNCHQNRNFDIFIKKKTQSFPRTFPNLSRTDQENVITDELTLKDGKQLFLSNCNNTVDIKLQTIQSELPSRKENTYNRKT